tara:strand:+ start:1310 stop:1969 length:660 start_codon:yes stop_codon:yes gene_type:complete
MELRKYQNLLNTLNKLRRINRGIGDSITTLEMLIEKENYDLQRVGSSGIVLFGSNKSFAKKINKERKINKDQIQTDINNLQKHNLVWRLTRQLQEDVGENKKERKGFLSALFILPTYKEFQAELYNRLKKAETSYDLHQIIARMLWVSNSGFNDEQLKDKVLVARNYKDKKYKDNIINNLISVWSALNPKKVVKHKKDQKDVVLEQLEYNDKGKVKLLH